MEQKQGKMQKRGGRVGGRSERETRELQCVCGVTKGEVLVGESRGDGRW